ncbi:hypothetical protein QSU96_21270 [Vibrio furnissii]|uniref:hypothetical protein n=1 Tax=Vibrio furnissii TaxID=29494 RepID=UPI0025737BE8|nr:hypothetical protein [Vibrio furnissii]WJG28081.1 hypothetical protein QSU96_21270 [Vibrio furnissii]
MKRFPLWAGSLLMLCSTPTLAKTVLTEKNLNTYLQIMQERDALDDSSYEPDEPATELTFATHCDWQRHYQDAVATAPANDVTEVEAIAKRHGFAPVDYYEFTHKLQWMSLEEMQMVLKSSEAMLNTLPADSRAELEIEIINQNKIIALLQRCMTQEDKQAAQRLKPVMMKKIMQMIDNS